MIRFYFKIQNNILAKNFLYIISGLVIVFNIVIRFFPETFIHIPKSDNFTQIQAKVNLTQLYTYCDVYLLILFVILIFFFLGIDFRNSMEDITLAIGGSKTNKFMLRKLIIILLIYIILYMLSFINIYTLYLQLAPNPNRLTPIKEVLFYSITTNFFVISLSLFILFMSRDIAVSTSIITAYYLIEEALWRCKITKTNGVLGHIYQYYDYAPGEILKVKLVYIVLSFVLLVATYNISKHKKSFNIICSITNHSR